MNELLLGRYTLPVSINPDSILARHEAGLFDELRAIVADAYHRSTDIARRVLPLCQPAMEAIGHRMAYDAARAANVRGCLVDLYVANVVKLDSSWYSEHAALSRTAQRAAEEAAHDAVLPLLGELVREMDVFAYVNAPIASDGAWDAFVDELKVFRGDSEVDLFNDVGKREGAEKIGIGGSHL